MTFETRSKLPARPVLWMLELELDWCSNIYSIDNGTTSFCTANNENECYQTRASCQDPANWNPDEDNRVTRFIPLGFTSTTELVGAIPSIVGAPSFAPSQAEPGGLGKRASVTGERYDRGAP